MAKYKIEDFVYDGKYHAWFWDPYYNANATITNALANCTTLAYGLSYVNGLPQPVSRIVSASNWHKVLINGWTSADYGSTSFKVGDIIQWVAHCHVATVIRFEDGEPILGCSWYTGEHGVSRYNGHYDTREQFSSLEEVSNFMAAKYPYRFYHEATIVEESNMVGGLPEHVLVAPEMLEPVEKDTSRNQIEVLTNEQNVRDNDNNIVGIAKAGYYNVYQIKKSQGYDWYEVADNRYIAGVSGRVVYIPADMGLLERIKELETEVDRCHKVLEEIHRLSEL